MQGGVVMLVVWNGTGNGAKDGFAEPTWNDESVEKLRLEDRLPADHLALRIEQMVDQLDLTALFASYAGVGKKAHRPDLMVKIVLYEIHSHRLSPAQWARDVQENEPLRWLARGIQPSRTRLYDFRDRIARFVDDWNAAVLQLAVELNVTPASRAALDGTFVDAHASRRQLANEERLEQRQRVVQDALKQQSSGQERPNWLASSPRGLRQQQAKYKLAREVLQMRLNQNEHRRSSKRKPTDKVLVSYTDPESALGRDKLGVFRPLYNVQLMCDLDSPLVLAYDTFAATDDAGMIAPMLERTTDLLGRKVNEILADSSYASLRDLASCSFANVTLFAPWQENDYSKRQGKKKSSNQFARIPKSDFKWLDHEQTFECPEGQQLEFRTKKKERRLDYDLTMLVYSCPGELCRECRRQSECTPNPKKGRTVSRMENEELLDDLRERMQTPEAKALYKMRARTVELAYADMKEHRGLRRFRSRGLERAKTQVGLTVLAHNLLAVRRALAKPNAVDSAVADVQNLAA
jgi:transposase